jgi:hypothetical protein
MKRLALTLAAVLACLATAAFAEDAAGPDSANKPGPWKLHTVLGATLAQSAFSDNWSGGDKGSLTWVLGLDATAGRQFTRKYNLSNQLLMVYGQRIQQVPSETDPHQLRWERPRKSIDQIRFESVSRFSLGGFVDPFLAVRMESQFRDESNPVGALSLNPVKLTEGAGLARVLKKSKDEEWITKLGFAFRQSFGRSIPGSDPTETVSFSTNDGGIEWLTAVTQPVLDKRVLYQGRLWVFKPVFFSKADSLVKFDAAAIAAHPERRAVADYWKTVELDFQNTFSAHITRVITVNLVAQLVYTKFNPATNVDLSLPLEQQISTVDLAVRPAAQFKEALTLGLSYSLF